MVAIGMLAFWGAYGVGTWGWCLVKGYNVTFGQWFNPLKPYMWPKGGPEMVPAGQVLPTGKGGQDQAGPAAKTAKAQVA